MATSNNKMTPFLGTELKINVNIAPIGDVTMDDYDFMVEMYCSPKKVVTTTKAEAIRIDNSNYVVIVDTNEVGAGELKCKVTAQVPDGDFPDALRTEVVAINTDITIVKAI